MRFRPWLFAAALLGPFAVGAEELARIERLDPRFDALLAADAKATEYARDIMWAEGPVWDASGQRLLFSDVPRNVIYSANGRGEKQIFRERSGYSGATPYPGREPGSNGLTFDARGQLVMCQHGDRAIARVERDGSVTVLAQRYEGQRFNSPNDLVFASNGDLYFTDPPYGLPKLFDDPGKELRFQGVFRVSPQGQVQLVAQELTAPNGVALSPDEKTLYVANSAKERPVWMAYPVRADGSLGPGKELAHARKYIEQGEPGLPDGLKVDSQGNLWAAGPGGVHVFDQSGVRLGRIVTGVPTGNVAWGEDGSVLFIAANSRILRLQTKAKGNKIKISTGVTGSTG